VVGRSNDGSRRHAPGFQDSGFDLAETFELTPRRQHPSRRKAQAPGRAAGRPLDPVAERSAQLNDLPPTLTSWFTPALIGTVHWRVVQLYWLSEVRKAVVWVGNV
jgi:hypothetical protein